MVFGSFLPLPWILSLALIVLFTHERKQRKTEKELMQRRIQDARNEAALEIAQMEKRTKDEIAQIEAIKQSELYEMRQKAEQRIKEERESILAHKEFLRTLSDKEVMIECMSALNTYAQRLDRLENRMSNMAISLDGVLKKVAKEKRPYAHMGKITDADLLEIVRNISKRIGRVVDVTVNDAVVRGTVLSQHKLSTWSFSIDFNDDGQLTGNYTVLSENDDSAIPQKLATEISKEIVYRLNI